MYSGHHLAEELAGGSLAQSPSGPHIRVQVPATGRREHQVETLFPHHHLLATTAAVNNCYVETGPVDIQSGAKNTNFSVRSRSRSRLKPPFFVWSRCRCRPNWVGAEVGSGTLGFPSRSRCRCRPKKWRLRNTST